VAVAPGKFYWGRVRLRSEIIGAAGSFRVCRNGGRIGLLIEAGVGGVFEFGVIENEREGPAADLLGGVGMDDVEDALGELIALHWVSVDDDTGELWVQAFIRLDASRRPNIFIAAMRATQTRRSRALRYEAWLEIDRLYQQQPLKPLADDASDKARKAHRDAVQAREDAHEQLRARVLKEGFGNRSGTVREPPSVIGPVGGKGVPPEQRNGPAVCERCASREYPVMDRGLCGVCLGRELGAP